MNRRTFVTSLASATILAAEQSPVIKPAVLKEGDTVGLITPSTYVSDPDALIAVQRTVDYFRLKAKYGPNVRKKFGYLGGTVQERVDDLHLMFRDPEVKAVIAIRGGYGSAQLLDHIDYDLIRTHPKIFLGYSDITAMLLGIHQKTGLITFHGPVALSQFTPYTQEHFRRALFQTDPIGSVTNPKESNALRPTHTLRTVRPGKAQGRLIGGNLTLLSTTLGTPYEVDTRGKIFFFEDVDEEPYRIDRMLTQLRLAGKLDAAAGIIFGECADCKPKDYKPSFNSTFTLGELTDNILGNLKIPVLAGLTIGHTDDQLTLPLGAMATLDADAQELTIEESALR